MNEVISIKYDRILLLGRKSDIKFKIYWLSKSIPAAKSQNFVDISGAQKPIWAEFLEFDFFYLKRQGYIDITRAKINFGVTSSSHTNLTMKLLIKLYLLAQKQGKREFFFGKQYLTFSLT